jgi:hypothetical protein
MPSSNAARVAAPALPPAFTRNRTTTLTGRVVPAGGWYASGGNDLDWSLSNL